MLIQNAPLTRNQLSYSIFDTRNQVSNLALFVTSERPIKPTVTNQLETLGDSGTC